MSKKILTLFMAIVLPSFLTIGSWVAFAAWDTSTKIQALEKNTNFAYTTGLMSDGLKDELEKVFQYKNDVLNQNIKYVELIAQIKSLREKYTLEEQELIEAIKTKIQDQIGTAQSILAEHGNTSIKDLIEKTIQESQDQLVENKTLEQLVSMNSLLAENIDLFKVTTALEKREAWFSELTTTIPIVDDLIKQVSEYNNYRKDKLDAMQSFITANTARKDDTAFDYTLVQEEWNSHKAKLAVIQSEFPAEKARIDQERAKAKKQEEEARAKAQKAYNNPTTRTYKHILVDISDQTIYFYEGDTVVKTSLVVTGRPRYPTVQGRFAIYAKAYNVTARGCADGSCWATPLKYWMPFYGGYGLHDAWWQPYFGGTRRFENNGEAGSHGCVNLPTDVAAWLWNWSEIGTTVDVQE